MCSHSTAQPQEKLCSYVANFFSREKNGLRNALKVKVVSAKERLK